MEEVPTANTLPLALSFEERHLFSPGQMTSVGSNGVTINGVTNDVFFING